MEAVALPDRVKPDDGLRPPRVFLSYAHDSHAHRKAVQDLWVSCVRTGSTLG
jgi:hypothetical protein